MKHRMRCSRCLLRFPLRKHPSHYAKPPRCPSCRTGKVYSTEDSRRREMQAKTLCRCDRYPFPHKQGEIRMCIRHPLEGTEPTGEELAAYQSCIEKSLS